MRGFTTKEVLLSSNDKYDELDRKLTYLRQLTSTSKDKYVKDVNYRIIHSEKEKNPELYCCAEWDENTIKGAINKLKIKSTMFTVSRESCKVVKDNNGRSYILSDEFHLYIPEANQETFGRVSDELLKDNFVQKVIQPAPYYGDNVNLSILGDGILMHGVLRNRCYLTNFYYDARHKTAQMYTGEKSQLTDKMLKELFNTLLDDECFSRYTRDFVETSPSKDKEIIVPEFDVEEERVDFNVEEDAKGLRLIIK